MSIETNHPQKSNLHQSKSTNWGQSGSAYFHIAALAGAGTGKTYSLVENYLEAILGLDPSGIKKRPSEILALTFTEKAANEMRLRIARRLGHLLLHGFGPEDPLLIKAHELNISLPKEDELRRLLRALPNASILTFHSFAAWLLRTHAAELGLNEQFDICQPASELKLAKNILRPQIIGLIKADNKIIKSLVARFRLSSSTVLGLIDALIEFYLDLHEQGINISQLARQQPESQALWDQIIVAKNLVQNSWVKLSRASVSEGTRLRLEELAFGLAELDKSLLSENEPKILLSKDEGEITKARLALKPSLSGNWGPKDARASLIHAVAQLDASLVNYFTNEDALSLASVLAEFDLKFKQHKQELNFLSFADLQVLSRQGLLNNPDLSSRLRARFKHILVDEYQDTSPIQEDIIALLAGRSWLKPSTGTELETRARMRDCLLELDFLNGASLFVVGDKKQSIYGFRGADLSLFDRMVTKMSSTHAESKGFEKRLLKINRRSQPKLLEFINLVSRHSLRDQGYESSLDLEPVSSETALSPNRAELWVLDDDSGLPRTVANLRAAVIGLSQLINNRPGTNLSDIVVLVRRIKSASQLKSQLATLGIAAKIIGGDGFYRAQEVIDILAALKLVINPNNPLACAIVLRSPLVLLSDHELSQLALSDPEAPELSLSRALAFINKLSLNSANRLNKFIAALELIRSELFKRDLAWAINILLDQCDLAFSTGLSPEDKQKWANINKLKYILGSNKLDYYQVININYQHIFDNTKEAIAESEVSEQALSIMTIHQAKGLEFPIVVLADSEGSLPPNTRDFFYDFKLGLTVKPRGRIIQALEPDTKTGARTHFQTLRDRQNQREQAELARLLYVAITRPKNELFIACSQASWLAQDRSPGLLGLLLRAHKYEPELFSSLCPVQLLNAALAPTKANPARLGPEHEQAIGQVYQPVREHNRIFSSMLKAHDEADLLPASSLAASSEAYSSARPAVIDGSLAHKILALAAPALSHLDRPMLELMIDAIARQTSTDSPYQIATKAACYKSLNLLKSILSNSHKIIPEMPLLTEIKPGLIIEGIADLVLEYNNKICVIEYKSSLRLAEHKNTYLQVLAYACALSRQSIDGKRTQEKPIYYAVHLVGSTKPIEFKSYDKAAEKELHRHC